MFAVINSEGKVLSVFETKEACEADMMCMPDSHPLDDKEVVDLSNLPGTLTDQQKYGIIRSIMNQRVPSLKDFLEDLITDHEWYKECMNPQFEEEDDD